MISSNAVMISPTAVMTSSNAVMTSPTAVNQKVADQAIEELTQLHVVYHSSITSTIEELLEEAHDEIVMSAEEFEATVRFIESEIDVQRVVGEVY